jgi:hypothetical protein
MSAKHELVWLAPGETAPERDWCIIQFHESMINIAENTTGSYLLIALPNATKLNGSYDTSEIFKYIKNNRRHREQAKLED